MAIYIQYVQISSYLHRLNVQMPSDFHIPNGYRVDYLNISTLCSQLTKYECLVIQTKSFSMYFIKAIWIKNHVFYGEKSSSFLTTIQNQINIYIL